MANVHPYQAFRIEPDHSSWCVVCECDTSVGNGHTDVQCTWELKQRLMLLEHRIAELEAWQTTWLTGPVKAEYAGSDPT